jgi:hypothetical protein
MGEKTHEHQCSCFLKNIFLVFQKIEIKYAYIYIYWLSKGTVEILEKNMLYFKLYKKGKVF